MNMPLSDGGEATFHQLEKLLCQRSKACGYIKGENAAFSHGVQGINNKQHYFTSQECKCSTQHISAADVLTSKATQLIKNGGRA